MSWSSKFLEELTFCKKCLEKHFLQIVAGDQDFWPKMKDMHYVFLQTRVPRLETGFFLGDDPVGYTQDMA